MSSIIENTSDSQEESSVIRYRDPVRQVGFAQISHLLTRDNELSDGAFRLYSLILEYAQQSNAAWPGVECMASALGTTERTITRRLTELQERGLITRERRFGSSSITWIEDLRAIYTQDAQEILDERERKRTERAAEQPSRTPVRTGQKCPVEQDKNVASNKTKMSCKEQQDEQEQAEQENAADVDLSEEQEKSFLKLTAFGIDDSVAKKLVRECESSDVDGWLAAVKSKRNLKNPAGFVVSKLRNGDPPPTADVVEQARQRAKANGEDGFERPVELYEREAEQWDLMC